MSTKIEWCDETINPIQDARKGPSGRGYHCTKCSPGCLNCYAERINKIRGNGEPFDDLPVEFELIRSELDKLDPWRKPRSVFVQSMGDLFHPDVPQSIIDAIFDAIWRHPLSTFLILTKRANNMTEYLCTPPEEIGLMSNLWRGLTICNQQEADEKLPEFLKIPGKKFLSIEPMLGAVDLSYNRFCGSMGWGPPDPPCRNRGPAELLRGQSKWLLGDGRKQINAVILGGETGPGARPMNPDWVRSVRDQCEAAGVPFFFKGWGRWRNAADFKNGKMIPGSERKGRLLDGREHNDLPWRKRKHCGVRFRCVFCSREFKTVEECNVCEESH